MRSRVKIILLAMGIGLGVYVVQFLAGIMVAAWIVSEAKESGEISTAKVREEWAKSALANSEYFRMTEITEKAKDDRIYLWVEGVEAEVAYVCRSTAEGLARECMVAIEKDGKLDFYRADEERDLFEWVMEKGM